MQWQTKLLHILWGTCWLMSSIVFGVCFVRDPVMTIFSVLSGGGILICGYLFVEVFNRDDE